MHRRGPSLGGNGVESSGGGGIRTLGGPKGPQRFSREGLICRDFRSGNGFAGSRNGVRCTMRCTESPFPASYFAVHRYDGAVIQRGRRERLGPCRGAAPGGSLVGGLPPGK